MTLDSTPAAAHQAQPFQHCLKDAASGSTRLMDALVRRALASLQQRQGDNGVGEEERRPLADARRLLSTHQSVLVMSYPAAIAAALDEASGPQRPRAAPGIPSFDQLELMDETQVQESVEVVRAQQAALTVVEVPLAELTALICAAQGLASVQAERNPLRPETYVRALRQAVSQTAQTGVGPRARLLWLQHLGEALGPELATVYSHLTALLRQAGVTAAAYTVTTAPEGGYFGPSAKSVGAAPVPPVKPEEVLLTVDRLRRLLAGELDAPGESFSSRFARQFESPGAEPPPADFGHTVPAAFEALQEMKQVDKVMQRLAGRNAAPPPAAGKPASLREQLRSQAHGMGQSLAIEVVNLMVDNLAGDARLMPPMQQAVRDLEPALLRLALVDQRFFSDRAHPARRLLEQMTQRSLAWDNAAAPDFAAFMQPVRQAVEKLAVAPIEDAGPFEQALATLEKSWQDQRGRERQERTKAVHALLHAEQRHVLAERITRDLQARPDIAQAPAAMTYFLYGPWAQVMAQARLSDREGAADPGGYGEVINDLLWTAQPEMARQNLARLTRLVPTLVARLREGLASIDYPADETAAFFDDLMALHQYSMRPGGMPFPASATAPATRAELEARFETSRGAGPWLAPQEAMESGFLDTDIHDHRPLPVAFEETQPWAAPGARPTTAAPTGTAARLETGAWVELQVGGSWKRMQLTWASPHGTLFMFTGPDGETRSLPRRALDQMLARSELRLLVEETVVDGALNAVAQAAMRNSLDLAL
jgi:hypothetical protein